MTLGEHILILRKQKNLSQSALGKLIGTSGDIIGRYERSIITPSIEVTIKLADILNVSIDFLVGKTTLELDKEAVERLEHITTLPKEKRRYLFNLMDIILRDFKTQKAYA